MGDIQYEKLEQLALSLDYMTGEQGDQIERFLGKYIKTYGIETFLIYTFVGVNADGIQNLKLHWRHDDRDKQRVDPVWNEGKYSGQAYYAYDKNKPLWITSGDNGIIQKQGPFIEHWSNVDSADLPDFWEYNEIDAKTSILIPLSVGNSSPIGFFAMETSKLLELDSFWKKWVGDLSQTISRLLTVFQNSAANLENTTRAINRLQESIPNDALNKTRSPNMKPSIFLSCSDTCDKDVEEILIETLQQYADRLQLIVWRDLRGRNIYEDLLDVIRNSDFGIAYFSEPTTDGKYCDNRNVLFEAGMMHGLAQESRSWISIREDNSIDDMPFNLKPERTIVVPRMNDRNGTLKHDELKTEFDSRICKLNDA